MAEQEARRAVGDGAGEAMLHALTGEVREVCHWPGASRRLLVIGGYYLPASCVLVLLG
jgi:hypothetical protein